MQSERKTQIYLSEAEHRALKRRAAIEGRSMAGVVREAVADYLAAAPRGRKRAGGPGDPGDPLLGLSGIAEGRAKDSARIDEVLYGTR